MPRRKVISGSSGVYRNYRINEKYSYDGKQLDIIIDALEYYQQQSKLDPSSDYVVFEITINIDETTKSPLFNPMDYDDGCSDFSAFNPNSLKSILPADQFYCRWTQEYKDDRGMGEHYHLMVIANHFPLRDMIRIQKTVESLQGVRTAFISPRVLPKQDHRSKVHFHWLNNDGIDGIEDAVYRHCYKAKLDQKLEWMKRSFDGSRELKPLIPVSKRNQRIFLESKEITIKHHLPDAIEALDNSPDAVRARVIADRLRTVGYEPF